MSRNDSGAWITRLQSIHKRYNGSYDDFNTDWASVVRGIMTTGSTPQSVVDTIRKKDKSARLIALRSINVKSKVISRNGYTLQNGSCHASIDLSKWYAYFMHVHSSHLVKFIYTVHTCMHSCIHTQINRSMYTLSLIIYLFCIYMYVCMTR